MAAPYARIGRALAAISTAAAQTVGVPAEEREGGGRLTKSSHDGHNPVFADFITGGRALISLEMIE